MTAIQVAQIIIHEAKQNNITLNNTKLQKLLYIIYGLYLVENRNILFSELPLYLPYGPVFDSVYEKYKNQDVMTETFYNNELYNENNFQSVLNTTLEIFGKYNAKVLSDWSHRDGSAWDKINKFSPEKWGIPLSILDIVEEFTQIIEQE